MKSQRGVFLVQTLILVLLLALLASLLLKMSLGRYTVVRQGITTEQMRHLGDAVKSQIEACAAASVVTACNVGGAGGFPAACIPATIGAMNVSVQLGGAQPPCTMTVSVTTP